MTDTSKFKVLQPVTYVPRHAEGNLHHSDVERGYVTSINDEYVFVCFNGVNSQACRPEDLR